MSFWRTNKHLCLISSLKNFESVNAGTRVTLCEHEAIVGFVGGGGGGLLFFSVSGHL